MLALLVAFGAALFIWFHADANPEPVDAACHVPENVLERTQPVQDNFVQHVFERENERESDVE